MKNTAMNAQIPSSLAWKETTRRAKQHCESTVMSELFSTVRIGIVIFVQLKGKKELLSLANQGFYRIVPREHSENVIPHKTLLCLVKVMAKWSCSTSLAKQVMIIIKFSSLSAPTKIEELTLIRNDPDKSEFTKVMIIFLQGQTVWRVTDHRGPSPQPLAPKALH